MNDYDNVKVTEAGYVLMEQQIRIKLTDGQEIVGKINIAEYGVSRISELFTRKDLPFIVVFDYDCQEENCYNVLFVNRDHILWAQPM